MGVQHAASTVASTRPCRFVVLDIQTVGVYLFDNVIRTLNQALKEMAWFEENADKLIASQQVLRALTVRAEVCNDELPAEAFKV